MRYLLGIALVLAIAGNAGAQTRTMIFPSKPGVCGDGESYISMGQDDEGRRTTFTQNSRGVNTSIGSRNTRRNDCVEGPVRVELRTERGRVVGIETFVGRAGDAVNTSAAEAVRELLDLAESSPNGTVAKHAILPALLADRVDPSARLLALARNANVTREARKSAIFWLSQLAGDRATEGLTQILSDPDLEVKKQAVFALSQIKGSQSTDALISVVKTSKDREVRKSALFWLGQSNDPRVLALFEDILLKN